MKSTQDPCADGSSGSKIAPLDGRRRSQSALPLGAGWKRMARQLLTESILLSLIGGAAGVALAWWALYVVRAIHPGNIPRLDEIGIDASVLTFAFAVSLATGILFGLA